MVTFKCRQPEVIWEESEVKQCLNQVGLWSCLMQNGPAHYERHHSLGWDLNCAILNKASKQGEFFLRCFCLWI